VGALAVAVIVVMVAGVVGVTALTGGGDQSPEAAVRGMMTAAGSGDFLGVLDHLDPAERDAVEPFLTGTVSDLKRLGVVTASADLHRVSGVSVTFDNLVFATAAVRPGLSAVTINSGTAHSHVDPSSLPIGPYLRQRASAALASAKPEDKTTQLHTSTPIVAVRHSGSWYVSLGYTLAEDARVGSHSPLPSATDAVPAVGADSPTAAVDALFRALARLDLRRAIELTPPDEMGALHDYAPLFLPRLDDAVAKQGAAKPTISITSLELSSTPHAGGALVVVRRFGVTVSTGSESFEYDPVNRCLKVTKGDASSVVGACGHDQSSARSGGTCDASGSSATPDISVTPDSSITACEGSATPDLQPALKALKDIHPELGIVTVERGGKWFVSPVRTLLDDAAAVLHAVSAGTLDTLTKAGGPGALLFPFALPLTSASPLTSGRSTARTSIGSAAAAGSSGPVGTLLTPVTTPCQNGYRTVTFPAGHGAVPPPMTIPCRQ